MRKKTLWIGLWAGLVALGWVAVVQAGISGVNPAEGTVGTALTISGSGFGTNPHARGGHNEG